MALAADRLIKRRDGSCLSDPVAATTKIYTGALVCLNSAGNAVPGSATNTLKARGVCIERADNSAGAAGDISVDSRPGVYNFKNSSAGDLITRAEIGIDCYIVDDQTVAKTSGSSTRSIAGKVVDVNADGVWVRIGS